MSGKVLILPSELSNLMKAEPVVLIDTRDPAIYAEAHIPGAVDVREVFTYLAGEVALTTREQQGERDEDAL